MHRIITMIAAISILGINAGFASFAKKDAGTSTAQFLKLGAGARAAGMGEAFCSVTDDSNSIYWNPAGLISVSQNAFSVMHAVWIEDISYDWVSYARNMKGMGTIGMGLQYLSYGSMVGTDINGLETNSFSPTDMSVSISYARNVKEISVGANIKYISSKITNSASAFAIDAGILYRLNEKLRAGFSMQNLGTTMKFDSQEDILPVNIRLGGEYLLKPQWIAALDINAPVDSEVSFGLGTEYIKKISGTMSAAGRLGYNSRAKDTGGFNGISAGIGFTYSGYSIDYAFVPYGDIGATHRISLGIKF